MVANGELGDIRLVQAEYPQDWLTDPIEQTGQKQAAWRTDPKQSGAGGAIGDIGTHAYNLARFVSGLELDELSRRPRHLRAGPARSTTTPTCMLRFKPVGRRAAKGMLWASQVAPGNENGLKLRDLRHQGRPRMGAGRSELPLVHAVRRAEAADHARRRRRRRRPPARVTRVPSGPSGRLSRRLRQHLPGGRARHPRRTAQGRQAGQGCHLSDGAGRRRGRRLRRGLREVVEEERRLDETLGSIDGLACLAGPSLHRISPRAATGQTSSTIPLRTP